MRSLREVQRSFGEALLTDDARGVRGDVFDDGFAADERVRVYRNTFRGTLAASLRMTYPAVDRLVGRDFFDAAAAGYVAAHLPRSGCLDDYGGEFADFLAGFEPAATIFYLPDVARFEWALAGAAHAPDAPFLDPGALGAVDAADHASLRFAPHPSVRIVLLAFPADRIADAVIAGDEAAMAAIDFSGGPIALLVHRGRHGVEAQRLDPAAYAFVSRLCAGERLAALAEAFPEEAPALLAEQLAKGRLTSFRIEP